MTRPGVPYFWAQDLAVLEVLVMMDAGEAVGMPPDISQEQMVASLTRLHRAGFWS